MRSQSRAPRQSAERRWLPGLFLPEPGAPRGGPARVLRQDRGGGNRHLEQLLLRNRDSRKTEGTPAAGLFILIGAQPFTSWLPQAIQRDQWGFILTRPDTGQDWPLQRAPFLLETTTPGVFAAGDVRHGAIKRAASAVGEGSTAIRPIHDYLALAPPPAKVISLGYRARSAVGYHIRTA